MSGRDPRELAAVFAGGGLGTLARAGLADAHPHGSGSWPWVTLAVNLAGALLLGCFATHLRVRPPISGYRRPFLTTGVCGGLTTFSTLQLELLQMLDDGHLGLAAGYAGASVALGYLAVVAGTALVRRAVVPA